MFLKKKKIGITISDRTIEVVEMVGRGKKTAVVSFNKIELEEGIIHHGRIVKEDILKKEFSRLFSSAQPTPIQEKDAAVALPDVLVYTHAFTLPEVPSNQKELEDTLHRAAVRVIPLPSESIVLSHAHQKDTDNGTSMFMAVSEYGALQEWRSFFKSIHIDVEEFDIEVLGQYKGLELAQKSDPVCIIDIGSRTTNCTFFQHHQITYNQTDYLGGDAFALALEGHVKDPQKSVAKNGLKQSKKEATAAITAAAKELARQLQKVIEYYEKKYATEVVTIIYIGGASRTPGLISFLNQELDREGVLGVSKYVQEDDGTFIAAAGVAASYIETQWKKNRFTISAKKEKKHKDKKSKTRSVADNTNTTFSSADDLYAELEKKKAKKQMIVLVVILLFGVLALVWAFWYQQQQRQETKQKQEDIRSQVDVLLEEATPVEKDMNQEDEVDNQALPIRQVEIISDGPTTVPVRVAPDNDSELVTRVSVGDRYAVYMEDETENWAFIQILDTPETQVRGWIELQYLSSL